MWLLTDTGHLHVHQESQILSVLCLSRINLKSFESVLSVEDSRASCVDLS